MLADDLIATFSSAQAAFTARVHAVAPDQWQLGTPDTQWTVADLVGHLVDSAAAFRADGALTGSVAITRGSVPAVEYLEEMVLDLIVHAWDLGIAAGYPGSLPAGPVAAIYPLAQAIVDRTPAGMFDPPVDVGADAPVIDRLVALTGRRPRPA